MTQVYEQLPQIGDQVHSARTMFKAISRRVHHYVVVIIFNCCPIHLQTLARLALLVLGSKHLLHWLSVNCLKIASYQNFRIVDDLIFILFNSDFYGKFLQLLLQAVK